jgi:hypothetical protein
MANELGNRADRPSHLGAAWNADSQDLKLIADARPGADDLRAILQIPHITLGSDMGAQQLRGRWRDDDSFSPQFNQLMVRAGSTYFGFAACCGDAQSIDDLDRLHDTLAPVSRIDAYFDIECDRERDQAYLELEILGLLDQAHRERWLAEAPRVSALFKAGVVGERLLWTGRSVECILSGKRLPERWTVQNPVGLADWLYDADLLADFLQVESHFEASGEAVVHEQPDHFLIPSYIGPDLGWNGLPLSIIEDESRHRVIRVAARLAGQSRALGHVPVDQADLDRTLGPHWSDGEVGLHYERSGTQRFLIAVEPSQIPEVVRTREQPILERLRHPTDRVLTDITPFGAMVDLTPLLTTHGPASGASP